MSADQLYSLFLDHPCSVARSRPRCVQTSLTLFPTILILHSVLLFSILMIHTGTKPLPFTPSVVSSLSQIRICIVYKFSAPTAPFLLNGDHKVTPTASSTHQKVSPCIRPPTSYSSPTLVIIAFKYSDTTVRFR